MKESTAEWLHDKGQKALKQSPWVIPIMAVSSLMLFLIWIGVVLSAIASGKATIAAIGDTASSPFLFLGLIGSLTTLLWFERRNYYEIIQSQERRIKELEKNKPA